MDCSREKSMALWTIYCTLTLYFYNKKTNWGHPLLPKTIVSTSRADLYKLLKLVQSLLISRYYDPCHTPFMHHMVNFFRIHRENNNFHNIPAPIIPYVLYTHAMNHALHEALGITIPTQDYADGRHSRSQIIHAAVNTQDYKQLFYKERPLEQWPIPQPRRRPLPATSPLPITNLNY